MAVANARMASGRRRNPLIAAASWPAAAVGFWALADRFVVDQPIGRDDAGVRRAGGGALRPVLPPRARRRCGRCSPHAAADRLRGRRRAGRVPPGARRDHDHRGIARRRLRPTRRLPRTSVRCCRCSSTLAVTEACRSIEMATAARDGSAQCPRRPARGGRPPSRGGGLAGPGAVAGSRPGGRDGPRRMTTPVEPAGALPPPGSTVALPATRTAATTTATATSHRPQPSVPPSSPPPLSSAPPLPAASGLPTARLVDPGVVSDHFAPLRVDPPPRIFATWWLRYLLLLAQLVGIVVVLLTEYAQPGRPASSRRRSSPRICSRCACWCAGARWRCSMRSASFRPRSYHRSSSALLAVALWLVAFAAPVGCVPGRRVGP